MTTKYLALVDDEAQGLALVDLLFGSIQPPFARAQIGEHQDDIIAEGREVGYRLVPVRACHQGKGLGLDQSLFENFKGGNGEGGAISIPTKYEISS